jgi:DNA-binding transcriptional MerR regulator
VIWHEYGLLPEPDRDTSGYRRYDAGALVVLGRITRLRAAGLSLPAIRRVRELVLTDMFSLGEQGSARSSALLVDHPEVALEVERPAALAADGISRALPPVAVPVEVAMF